MSRPSFKADIQKPVFEEMCKIHCTRSEIAGCFRVSEGTLQRWVKETYRDEMGQPMSFSRVSNMLKGEGNNNLRRAQFRTAMAGSEKMQIHLGKHWLGQTDNNIEEIEASNGGTVIRVRRFSDVNNDVDESDDIDDDSNDTIGWGELTEEQFNKEDVEQTHKDLDADNWSDDSLSELSWDEW